MTRRQKLRAASCLGKATYRTKPAALRAVADYKRRVPLIVDDVLDVYRCRFALTGTSDTTAGARCQW